MAPSVWQGKSIRLRGVEPEDWETFYEWDQDSEMPRNLYEIPFPVSRERTKRYIEQLSIKEPQDDTFHWVIEDRAGEIVGSVATHHCDRRVGTFSLGINVRREHRRRGYAAQAIVLVLRYYFEELGYQKVNSSAYSFNEASIKLHERLGFQSEGRQRRTVYTSGQRFDALLFGMTVEEFRDRYQDDIWGDFGGDDDADT